MAGRYCKGCNKNIHGRSNFCGKDCKTSYLERMEVEANRDKSKEVAVRINEKTVIYVKDASLVEAAKAKYAKLLAGGLAVQNRGVAVHGFKNRGLTF